MTKSILSDVKGIFSARAHSLIPVHNKGHEIDSYRFNTLFASLVVFSLRAVI